MIETTKIQTAFGGGIQVQYTGEGFRKFQLIVMGFIAVSIGPLTLLTTIFIHKLPSLTSISESGTIANRVSPILPYCLGALALFSLSYAVKHGYDRLDTVMTSGMFLGFTMVAMQMCASPYIQSDRVGVLGLTEHASNTVHDIGAAIGFGSMILWILVCFKQSNLPVKHRTREKRTRDQVYTVLGISMVASLSLLFLKDAGVFGKHFPAVFVVETLMLTFGGLACLIKGGFVLADSTNKNGAVR